MKHWQDFMPLILPEVNGASEMLVEQVLRQTAIDFITESRIHVEQMETVVLVEGDRTYELSPETADTAVVQIKEVWLEDRFRLVETTLNDLNDLSGNWRTHVGTPRRYVCERLGEITLDKAADQYAAGKELYVSAYIAPTQSSDGIADWLYERHAQHIADGTKGALMAMSGMQFANPAMSAYYTGLYLKQKNAARLDGKRQYGRANQTIRLRSF